MLGFTLATLLGIFYKHLIVLVILCFLEYFICTKFRKMGFIIPSLCGLYLLFAEGRYFFSIYSTGIDKLNTNVILYGLALIIPYGSLLFGTGLIAILASKKKAKAGELEKARV